MLDLLRSVWNEPRPPGAPRRVWRDWALVAVVVPVAALEVMLRPELPARVFTAILTAGLAFTLLWRRTRPLRVVVVGYVVAGLAPLVTIGYPPSSYTMAYLLILPYALFRWGSGREMVLGSAIMLGNVGFGLVLGRETLTDTVGGIAVLSATAAAGTAVRYRARARARELDQVKLLEREQLARDLHDTVAHHVSAMAIRAQAGLATSASHPDAATDALRVIEAEATRALAEMRAMVRVLRRGEPAEMAPSPRISDLEQLAGRSRTGPAVEVEIVGDVGDVPPSVGTAIYRLAQESVTNARRHARHATRIEVRVDADAAAVRLRVGDDGDTTVGGASAAAGFGLIGMMERVDLLGGTCAAGPDPAGGWTVAVTLPRTGTAG